MIYKQLKEQIVTEMKSRGKYLSCYRSLDSAIQLKAKTDKKRIDDTLCIDVIRKAVKQRQESASLYSKAGRNELFDIEMREMILLKLLLPKQMEDAEISTAVSVAIVDSDTIKDMGKVMGLLKDHYGNIMDMAKASKMVRERLSK